MFTAAIANLSFTGFGSASPSSRIRQAKARIVASAGAVTERKRSPYEILRVTETASPAEIKAAYRALAKQYHPDVDRAGSGNGSEFMEIQGAYATLSDPAAKASYDRAAGRVGFGSSSGLRVPRRRWETDQCW